MNKKVWIPAWIVMYVAAVAAGVFWPASVISRIVGVAFFAPPAVLLWQGIRQGNKKLVFWVRIIAIAALVLTLLAIIAVFLSVRSEKNLSHLMDAILLLVAAPMKCFKAWVVSLFGWACVLYGSLIKKKF